MPVKHEMFPGFPLAAATGVTVGYQRERACKPAGLRTYMLICLGSLVMTVASIYRFGNGMYLAVLPTVLALIVLFLPHPIR